MNWQSIADHWSYFGDRLRERWGRLTARDIEDVDGSREVLAQALQQRYGIDRYEADALLTEWQKDVLDDTPTLVLWQPPERHGASRSD